MVLGIWRQIDNINYIKLFFMLDNLDSQVCWHDTVSNSLLLSPLLGMNIIDSKQPPHKAVLLFMLFLSQPSLTLALWEWLTSEFTLFSRTLKRPNFKSSYVLARSPPHSKQHNSDKLSDLIMVWALLYEYIINYQALESNPKEQVWLCWR